MKLLITGASSYVGARLYFDLSKQFEIVGTYYTQTQFKNLQPLNITSQKEVNAYITKSKPDYIIHAAANANARWCEANPKLAYELNATSTKYIVDAANHSGSKIIYISSFAAINPINVYGETKQMSEEYIKKTKNGYIILRPSLIIGFSPNTINDRPFNRILKNLDEHTPAIYDTSWKFQPTYVHHISEIISNVIKENILQQTLPVAVPELKTRFDLAHDILQTFDREVTPEDKHDTTPVETADISILSKFNLPTYHYETIIEEIIEEIKNRKQFML